VPLRDGVRCASRGCSQLVFVDEKKFRAGEMFARSLEYGYAPAGQRLPLRYNRLLGCARSASRVSRLWLR
jgi:hypothetical protein